MTKLSSQPASVDDGMLLQSILDCLGGNGDKPFSEVLANVEWGNILHPGLLPRRACSSNRTLIPLQVRLAAERADSFCPSMAEDSDQPGHDACLTYGDGFVNDTLDTYFPPLSSSAAMANENSTTIADFTQYIVEELFINNKEAHFLGDQIELESNFISALLGGIHHGEEVPSEVIFDYGTMKRTNKRLQGKPRANGIRSDIPTSCIIHFALMEATEGYHVEIAPSINAHDVLSNLLSVQPTNSVDAKKLDLTLKAFITMCPNSEKKQQKQGPLGKRINMHEQIGQIPVKKKNGKRCKVVENSHEPPRSPDSIAAAAKHPTTNGIPPSLSEAWENQKAHPVNSKYGKEKHQSKTGDEAIGDADIVSKDIKRGNGHQEQSLEKSCTDESTPEKENESCFLSTSSSSSSSDSDDSSSSSSDQGDEEGREDGGTESTNSRICTSDEKSKGKGDNAVLGTDVVVVNASTASTEPAPATFITSKILDGTEATSGIFPSTSEFKSDTLSSPESKATLEKKRSRKLDKLGGDEPGHNKTTKFNGSSDSNSNNEEEEEEEEEEESAKQTPAKGNEKKEDSVYCWAKTPCDIGDANGDLNVTQESEIEPTVLFDEHLANKMSQHRKGEEIKISTSPFDDRKVTNGDSSSSGSSLSDSSSSEVGNNEDQDQTAVGSSSSSTSSSSGGSTSDSSSSPDSDSDSNSDQEEEGTGKSVNKLIEPPRTKVAEKKGEIGGPAAAIGPAILPIVRPSRRGGSRRTPLVPLDRKIVIRAPPR